jgi:hypothetical protein
MRGIIHVLKDNRNMKKKIVVHALRVQAPVKARMPQMNNIQQSNNQ